MSDCEDTILVVGLLCLDVVTVCNEFPIEDTDNRCVGQRWSRGGNAANSCTVLAGLGAACECLCSVARGKTADLVRRYLEEDSAERGISMKHCRYHDDHVTPCTFIIINRQTGSRTILYDAKSLPEYAYADFCQLDLKQNRYKWIHFEGRRVEDDIRRMLDDVRGHNEALPTGHVRITTSVELEKPRPNLETLLDAADYVFVSKDFAKYHGYGSKTEAVEGFSKRIRSGAAILCAWGEDGAAAQRRGGDVVTCAAYPPEVVIDTLGAGDTFNAAVIYSLCRHGNDLSKAIDFGCRVAGAKCGMYGYDGIAQLFR